NFPIRVLPYHLAIAKSVEVAAAYLYRLAIAPGSGEQPFRDAAVATDEMLELAIVYVGRHFESRDESAPHFGMTPVALAMGFPAAGHVECAIGMEVGHDAIDVVIVERLRQPVQDGQDVALLGC